MALTRSTQPFLLLIALFATCSIGAQADTLYKWVDDNGITHYSGTPPSGKSATKMKVSTPAPSSSPTPPPATKADATTAPDGQSSAAKPPIDKARCEQAAKNVKTLQEKTRIRTEENGQTRLLSAEEISEQLSINQDILKDECQ